MNKADWVEITAWITTAIAVIVVILLTHRALPLFAFLMPLCLPTIRKSK